ncbi:MAG: TonB-dependent receptor [Bacteroidia bacterium]
MKCNTLLQSCFFFVLLYIALPVHAQQTGEIRGFVYDQSNGEPIIFTNVYLRENGMGSATDVNGFYSITKVPPGDYSLVVKYVGYDSTVMNITVEPGKILNQNIYLEPGAFQLQTVEITEKGSEKQAETGVSVKKVQPVEIQRIPSVGGEPDLAQYLQVLPGVIFTGDQGGQIYIRGGSPIQNKVLMDGMTIYNPFHSIGFFSVFDVDVVRNIDVYTGGFGAEYGGRISAIMDITTRDGNKKELSGKVSASPFVAKLLVEGPLKKFKAGETSSSLLFTSRASYLKESAPIFYNYADSNGLPYNFLDFYGKYSWTAPGGTQFNLFGFNHNDRVTFDATTYNWKSSGGGTRFLVVPSLSSTVISGNFAYSDYAMEQSQPDEQPRYSFISGFESGLDFSYYPGNNEIKYGFDISGFKTDFEFYNAANRRINQTDYTTEIAGFITYRAVLEKWVIQPGLRMHYYSSLQEMSPEPRLALKYNLTEDVRFKMAAGLYSQNFLSAQSDRDVVNLFYGFLSGPEDLPDYYKGEEVTSRLQKARHVVFGIEFDLAKYHEFNIETYLKNFNQLTNINRDKIFDDSKEFEDEPDYLREDFIVETGDAYGIDFQYSYDRKPWYLWVVYSLGYVDRDDGRKTYHPHWDRRHSANIVTSYLFGKDQTWEVSARWNFGTGFPFTKTQGFYELLDFQQNGIYTDYTRENGSLGIVYAGLNEGRLPVYHRLDLSASKKFEFKNKDKLQLTLSIINAYNQENIFFFDRVKYQRINQLPILPSIGASYSF